MIGNIISPFKFIFLWIFSGILDTTPRIAINTETPYTPPDFPSWSELKSMRDIMGTMNGPREVYPVQDYQPEYNTSQYMDSFKALNTYAVRFNDLNYAQGGYNSTSITQIFTAWPTTDEALEALSSADIFSMASDDSNYVWQGIDYNVGGACDTEISLMDFRIGDTYQVTKALNSGDKIPISANGDTISFPVDWSFPTNVLVQNGIDLYTAVATHLAKRVALLCTKQKIVFDILTEIYMDTSGTAHFWPHDAATYTSLFAAVTTSIKSALNDDSIKFAGPNVIPSNTNSKSFFVTFIKACFDLGYDGCPLDLATFHYFSTDDSRPEIFTAWVHNELTSVFKGSDFPTPRMAITAWGLVGSGTNEYNYNITGAAYITEHLINIQSAPVDFAILYKFDGINCDDSGYPCLVEGESGKLKPNAMPFILHSTLLNVAINRLEVNCYYCGSGVSIMASLSDNSLAIFLSGADSGSYAPENLLLSNWKSSCGSSISKLTTTSVAVENGVGKLSSTTVSGSFSGGTFYEEGKSKPYSLPIVRDTNNGYYSALLILECTSTTEISQKKVRDSIVIF